MLIVPIIFHHFSFLFVANEKDYIGYEISGRRTGQEYTITISSYCEPEPYEGNANKVVCGCSADPSQLVECAPVSPPRSPKPFIKSISADGVLIAWEKAKEFGSADVSVRIFLSLCILLK